MDRTQEKREELNFDGVDYALAKLSLMERGASLSDRDVDEIKAVKTDLRIFKMFLWCCETWKIDSNEVQYIKTFVSKILDPELRRSSPKPDLGDWLSIAVDLKVAIVECKLLVGRCCERFSEYLLHFESLSIDEVWCFLDAVLKNLKDLASYGVGEIVPPNNQIEALKQTLMLMQDLIYLINVQPIRSSSSNLLFNVHTSAHHAAKVIILYWVESRDKNVAAEFSRRHSHVMQMIKPWTPYVMDFCSESLMDIMFWRFVKLMPSAGMSISNRRHHPAESADACNGLLDATSFTPAKSTDSLLLKHKVPSLVNLLLWNRGLLLKNSFRTVRESLIVLLTFLADLPQQHADDGQFNSVCCHVVFLFRELSCILSLGSTDENFSKKNLLLISFILQVEKVKDWIQQHYACNLLKTNILEIVDFFLQHNTSLKRCFGNTFFEDHIIKINEDLLSLRSFLKDCLELQDVQAATKEPWLQLINLVYQAKLVIDSRSRGQNLMLHHMECLFDFLTEIKEKTMLEKITDRKMENMGSFSPSLGFTSIHTDRAMLEKITDRKMENMGSFSPSLGFTSIHTDRASSSGANEVVGFDVDENLIIGRLTRGSKFLEIVSIVGMAGIGKTTLAKKVCNAPLVRAHFHVFAFGVASQVYNTRKLLLNILSSIIVDNDMHDMKDEDLADQLRKCLKGKRYLIVLDDIWEIRTWDDIKSSFPDDLNGSRVLFTTRLRSVALQSNSNCSPHNLHFLFDKESWALLQKKAFLEDRCPPKFSKVGKVIAKNCKGLPLAIVIIAGLLARIEQSLSWWNKIAGETHFYTSMEWCMDILEVSYKHLPEYLKSCFLYLGAFAEDKLISAKGLTLLWIAEGFVQKHETRSLENVAEGYLRDLVDRSLVIVAERSSDGGIKSCRIHDLVRDFCQKEARGEYFFKLIHGDVAPDTLDAEYRICVHMKWESFVDAEPKGLNVQSLLYCHIGEVHHCDQRFFSNFKLLHVLDLQEVRLHGDVFEEIIKLVHLRYLAILVFWVSSIPQSLLDLKNLEIFILRGNKDVITLMPETIWGMNRLRYVDVARFNLENSGGSNHEAYYQLNNMRSFSTPTLSYGKEAEELLQRLPNVQKLSCHFDESNSSGREIKEPPGLDFLSKLESLRLTYVGRQKPGLISFPSTIKKLSLSGFCQPWEDISAIRKLPCLKVLKLLKNSFVGAQWEMEDVQFPKLRFLKLEGLDLVQWNANSDSCPCLERLILMDCNELDAIPDCFEEVPTLQRIEVHMCNKAANSAIRIQGEQRELGNEGLEVIISKTFQEYLQNRKRVAYSS